jgi:hypothetical protein
MKYLITIIVISLFILSIFVTQLVRLIRSGNAKNNINGGIKKITYYHKVIEELSKS